MPERSGQDKAGGDIDKVTGRAKEAGGTLTGDKDKKAEGRADQDKGALKKRRAPSRTYLSNRKPIADAAGAVSYAPARGHRGGSRPPSTGCPAPSAGPRRRC
jgi:uncharacterized protein YjbJ (UPF0337 family)